MAEKHATAWIWLERERSKRERVESSRKQTLSRLLRWLEDHASEHEVERVLIFGSLTKPHRFGTHSDVDLALEREVPTRFAVELEHELDRDIDLVRLDECRFAGKIREEGVEWTRSR